MQAERGESGPQSSENNVLVAVGAAMQAGAVAANSTPAATAHELFRIKITPIAAPCFANLNYRKQIDNADKRCLIEQGEQAEGTAVGKVGIWSIAGSAGVKRGNVQGVEWSGTTALRRLWRRRSR
jgi:hypothetical protein